MLVVEIDFFFAKPLPLAALQATNS